MRELYHWPLVPAARKVRLALAEKGLDFNLHIENSWEQNEAFLKRNPRGDLPVLVEEDGVSIAQSWVICEYIEEAYPSPTLFGDNLLSRAETRRLVSWFDEKFYAEVGFPLLNERVFKYMSGGGSPDSRLMRAAKSNIGHHLDYISWLTDHRTWLAGDDFSLADITAAAHLSCLDFINDVPWDKYLAARDWYVRIKSRPSFQPLLADNIAGFLPPKHYADLDF